MIANSKIWSGMGSIVAAGVLLSGCGGGGSGSTASSTTVTGQVQASYLKGVKVCEEGTDNCAVTDQNGKFSLTTEDELPIDVVLKVGGSELGKLEVSQKNITIDPAVLADGNTTVASYVGALLHDAAGCAIATEGTCDLSGVKELDLGQGTEPIVEALKKALEHNKTIAYKINGKPESLEHSEALAYRSHNPEKAGVTDYSFQGAASEGDTAIYSYDIKTHKLSYQLSGNAFGDANGTMTLKGINGSNIYFTDEDGENFYFLSKSMGVAVVSPDPQYPESKAFVVGLQTPPVAPAPELLAGKEFNVIEMSHEYDSSSQKQVEVIGIDHLAFNSNHTFSGYYLELSNSGNKVEKITGTWEIPAGKSYFLIKDETGKPVAHAFARAKGSKESRTGFVIDMLDGGFGLGIEALPLKPLAKTAKFEYYDYGLSEGEYCLGSVQVNGDAANKKDTFSYDGKCYDEDGNPDEPENGKGDLILNPIVTLEDGTKVELNGLALVPNEEGNLELVYFDPEEGYYVSVFVDSEEGPWVSVGSNKPISSK